MRYHCVKMKVMTAILLILIPGSYTKPLRVSLQSLLSPKDYDNSVTDTRLYDPIFSLSKPTREDSSLYKLDNLLRIMPAALKDTYLIKLKETQLSLQDLSENVRNSGNLRRFQRRAFTKKDKRYVNSNKRNIQNNGQPYVETRNLTLCHFKICNMGRKRTTQVFEDDDRQVNSRRTRRKT